MHHLDLMQLRERYLEHGEAQLLPIVDAHLHFWNPQENYHPWLCDESAIPFRYGDYSAICRPFLPKDYLGLLRKQHIVIGTVYMEAEWDPTDAIGEAQWIHKLAYCTDWPNAMIGQAWLDRSDVSEQLEKLAQFPRLKGIRHKPSALQRKDYDPKHRLEGSLRCPKWKKGFSMLSHHGLLCELQVPWWHLHELMPLLEEYPDIPVIINHTGVPGDRDEDTLEGWYLVMSQLAKYPQVSVKISGLGLKDRPWSVTDNQGVILSTIDLFGVDRCMFASNFPVDSLVTDLATLWDGFKHITKNISKHNRLKLFCDNAIRIYQLNIKELKERD